MDKTEKTLSSQLIYKGKVISYYVDEVQCPNGNKSTREYVKHPGGVVILPILGNKIILENQFRYPFKKDILEAPAGKLNYGEDPKEAAIRELEEETGYLTNKLTYIGQFLPSVGYTDEILHLYVAEDLVKTKQHLDEDEALDLLEIDINDAKELIINGSIQDGKTIAIISKYLLIKESL